MAGSETTDVQRRLRARRQNERVKLLVSFLNTLSLAILGAAFVVPGMISIQTVRWSWIPFGVALHVIAQWLLSLLRSED